MKVWGRLGVCACKIRGKGGKTMRRKEERG